MNSIHNYLPGPSPTAAYSNQQLSCLLSGGFGAFEKLKRDAKLEPLPSAARAGVHEGAGPEKSARLLGDRAKLPRGWRLQQLSQNQQFMQDFLQIKKSFALIFLSRTAVCAFQDKPSSWLLLPGSSPRTSEREGLQEGLFQWVSSLVAC